MLDNRILHEESRSALALLKTMVDPTHDSTDLAPDINVSGGASVPGKVDYSLSYNVLADLPGNPAGAQVPGQNTVFYTDVSSFKNGMYIAFPQEGVSNVYHYGFVAGGSYAWAGFSTNAGNHFGLDLENKYVGAKVYAAGPPMPPTLPPGPMAGGVPNRILDFPGWRLDYLSELALPRLGDNNGFQISPNISEYYSKVRGYASKMVIASTTIAAGNFDLSGTFSSGIISDTRDICQKVGTNGVSRAFPTSSLTAQSVARGDNLRTSSVADGAVDLMGPDYPRGWTAPDTDFTDTLQAEWIKPTLAAYTNDRLLQSSSEDGGGGNPSFWQDFNVGDAKQYWVTPWDTDFYVANSTSPVVAGPVAQRPVNHERVRVPAINEDGVLDIDFSYEAQAVAETQPGYQVKLDYAVKVNYVHIFAYIKDGQVNYNVASETTTQKIETESSYYFNAFSSQAEANVDNYQRHHSQARPRMLRSGFSKTTGGKYLGTLVSVTAAISSFNVANVPQNNGWWFGMRNFEMRVRARNVDASGRVGPAHCIRYDDVAQGQQVNFQGTTLLRALAQGAVAPLTQQNTGAFSVPDNAFTKFVEILWGRVPNLHRITTLREYRDKILPWIHELTAEKILGILNQLDPVERDVAIEAGQAAGIFGKMLSKGARMLGLGDQSEIANVIGDVAEGAIAGLVGTSGGQYGSQIQPYRGRSDNVTMNSGGQFGAAAAQFGAAGSRRSRDF